MLTSPVWTVIIPIYNKAEYLDRCLSSVQKQTMTSWEAICVDDCSEDNSLDIINLYEKSDPRFIIIKNESNIGVGESRNKGIRRASGKYIHFLDADDFFDPDHLSNCYIEMSQADADIGFIRLNVDRGIVHSTGDSYAGPIASYGKNLTGLELLHEFVIHEENFLYACGMVSRCKFLVEKDLFFKKLRMGEGGDLVLRSINQARRAIKIDSGEGYHYCINDSSINSSPESTRLLLYGQLEQCATVYRELMMHPENVAYREFLEWYLNYISGGFKNLTHEESQKMSDDLEDEYHRFCLHIILNYKRYDYTGIKKTDSDIIKEYKRVVIFGAGYDSEKAITELHRMDVEIVGIYVSDIGKNRRTILGHPVEPITELQDVDKHIPVLITTKRRHHDEIKERMGQMGFFNVCIYGINE